MNRPKLNRGQKLCKNCKKINASRQRVCKHCGLEFICKNTPVKNEVKNWRELEIGAYIKIIQGTGPYFICSRDSEDGAAGEKICMGSTGVYRVAGITDSGIQAYGAGTRDTGYTFLYMGPPHKSKVTGTYLEPYRIKHENIKKNKR